MLPICVDVINFIQKGFHNAQKIDLELSVLKMRISLQQVVRTVFVVHKASSVGTIKSHALNHVGDALQQV